MMRSRLFAALLFTLCVAPALADGLFADRILVNGRILTVDADDSIAEAVAIRGGKIAAVGSNEEILALLGPETDHIDLQGLTATPGLLDSHVHFSSGGLLRLSNLDLSFPKVRNIEDVVAAVRQRVAVSESQQWILGRGWDEGKLAERRHIQASDIDPVTDNHPAWLAHTMGHYGVANSLSLALAGITRVTPDPPGGEIDRDVDGNATGVLKETAMALVTRHIPPASAEQMREGIRTMAQAFNRECMTGAKDPGIGPGPGYDIEGSKLAWDAYQDVLEEGALTVRVFALWHTPDTLGEAKALIRRIAPISRPYESISNDRLISGGVKLFADGSGGARTAWVWKDWNKDGTHIDEGNRGYPAIDADLLRQMILLYHDAGLHMGVHAIGDRAIDWVVAAFALALMRNPQHGLRHSIIHANIPTELAMNTMVALQNKFDAGYPEPQAAFIWWIGDTYAGNFGPRRSLRLNPLRTYLAKGIRWGGGSDFSVTPYPARYGIWSSMARRPALGVYGFDAFGQDETIDARTALRSFTLWAAHQMFLDDKTGSIEVGKYADIAVWNADLYSAPLDAIKNLECRLTLLQGDIVYRAPDSLVAGGGL